MVLENICKEKSLYTQCHKNFKGPQFYDELTEILKTAHQILRIRGTYSNSAVMCNSLFKRAFYFPGWSKEKKS